MKEAKGNLTNPKLTAQTYNKQLFINFVSK